MKTDYQALLNDIENEAAGAVGAGKVASYIPALARVPAQQFGIALHTVDGHQAAAGDSEVSFSIQSVSKVFGLTLAIRALGSSLWERIGREPSGNRFNSLVQLENEGGRPRNPFINAGALCVTDRLISAYDSPWQELERLWEGLCGEPLRFDPEVEASERATSHRNAALAHFIKSFGGIDNEPEQVIELYCRQCAIVANCRQLALAFGYLAHGGVQPGTGESIVTPQQARRINALMLTCGTYDAAGEIAFEVGLPCKSGVGGAIIAVSPSRLVLCAWSPGLDETGNSVAARLALERFVARTGVSIF